jgi:LCP family protein required for cell wall assembly
MSMADPPPTPPEELPPPPQEPPPQEPPPQESRPDELPPGKAALAEPQAEPGELRAVAGVPLPAKARSPLWTKAVIILGVLLMVVSLGLLGGEQFLSARYSAALHRSTLLAPNARHDGGKAPTSLAGPLNYLLIGSDARASNPSMGARSDTIIIVHIPATLDRAYLISIPRDLRVDIPPDGSFAGATGKINSSFQYGGQGSGGVQLLSQTLTRLTGITFDGAAVINFSGFDKVVMDLGGVRMCIDEKVKSIHTGHVFNTGCQFLTAPQALDYLRQRETLPGGDFDRQRHQQQFLQAIFSSMFASGETRNPLKLDQIIRAVGASMTVDLNGVPLDQLVYSLRNIQPSALVGVRVPSYPKTIGGVSFVVATGDAGGLYRAVVQDTMDAWVQADPQWVNTL